MYRQCRDVGAVQQNASRAGAQDPRQQIDHRGFAGAIWPDQRVTRACLDSQRQVAGDGKVIEPLLEPNGFQRERHESYPYAAGLLRQSSSKNAKPSCGRVFTASCRRRSYNAALVASARRRGKSRRSTWIGAKLFLQTCIVGLEMA